MIRPLSFVLALFLLPASLLAQAAPITYQGRLDSAGTPYSGSADVRFTIYAAADGGSPIDGPYTSPGVPVFQGLFTAEFTPNAATFDSPTRYLEVAVRAPADVGSFTPLAPRQRLTSAAYAVHAQTAGSAALPWAPTADGIRYSAGGVSISSDAAGTTSLRLEPQSIRCVGTPHFTLNAPNTCDTAINNSFFITTNNRVGVGVPVPAFRLELPNISSDVGGRGRANAWVTYSSRRWKENITPIESPLDKALRLQGVMFDWKTTPESGGGTHDIGFIAEEVGEVVPELVSWEPGTGLASGLKYDRITALLVEALKVEHTRTDASLAALQIENAELRMRIERLEKLLASELPPRGERGEQPTPP